MSETRLCRITNEPFIISDREIEFCKQMDVPLPTVSPEERLRCLMSFRNEWKLYRRKCDATGQEIISAYTPDSPFQVYNNTTWWGDAWDAMEYGREFDFKRSFFEQFAELQKAVPREGTSVFHSENCDFNSHWRKSKNCYLNSLGFQCEDVYYSYWLVNSKDVFDSAYANESTLCYECTDLKHCYNVIMLHEASDCHDCFFSYQLQGCDNCIFCTNLVRKSFHIFNKPVSKTEFLAFKEKLFDGLFVLWQKNCRDFWEMRKKAIQRNVHTLKCENCTGDHIYNSKNCFNCFDAHESEDCENSISLGDSKDIVNCYSAGWTRCEMIYYSVVSRSSMDVAFCNYTWFSSNMRYCDSCVSCQNCFGCIGLRHKQYCILNKQYSKEEYEKLLPRIIEYMKKTSEWGEFFLPQLSPYAVNETAVQDFFHFSRKEATTRGYRWREEDKREYQPATIKEIPDSINEVKNTICSEILACVECGKNYRIIPQELKFYRLVQIPIPHECPSCRHTRRMRSRNPLRLWKRPCAKCNQPMETSYTPDRSEIIFCEKCYLTSVY